MAHQFFYESDRKEKKIDIKMLKRGYRTDLNIKRWFRLKQD